MSFKQLFTGLLLLIVMAFVVPNNTALNAQTTAPTQPTVGNTVAPTATQIPKIDLSISPIEGKEDYSVAIQVLILLTVFIVWTSLCDYDDEFYSINCSIWFS
jgi:hypothetical protein